MKYKLVLLLLTLSTGINAQLKLSDDEIEKLKKERVCNIEKRNVKIDWVRHVGKNSRLDNHGYGPRLSFNVLTTESSLKGIGELSRIEKESYQDVCNELLGKSVWETIDPSKMLVKKEYRIIDVSIYDLIGIILHKPVYRLFGVDNKKVKCYSGMIYMDDLEFSTLEDGIEKVLENCRMDYSLGYRYFKLKIGRGAKWMSHDEGLERDIYVTKIINERFPDVKLLVDANDGYSVDDCIEYIDRIKPIKLYWMEEPFKETEIDYLKLRKWQKNNNPDIFLADGEFRPDFNLLMTLCDKGIIDVYLQDILGYGFTNWMELLPILKTKGIYASPHCWGSGLRTIYSAYLGMIFDNIDIIEGVTCSSDDLDFEYNVKEGYFVCPEKPGFGITINENK